MERIIKMETLKKKEPWEKLNSRKVHRNPWFSVREDKVVQPDGKKGHYYVVDLNQNESVAVIAREKNNIYLVGQTRYPMANQYSWEIIGGSRQKGVNILDSAKNELREEAGITAKKWNFQGILYPANGYSSEEVHVFLAEDLERGQQQLEPTEDITVKRFEISDIKRMIKEGAITDAFSIASLYKYFLKIK